MGFPEKGYKNVLWFSGLKGVNGSGKPLGLDVGVLGWV
jgi:hypothetical protein